MQFVNEKGGPAEAASPTLAVENTRTADNLLPQWPAPDSVPWLLILKLAAISGRST
jgi:hypothetical protein